METKKKLLIRRKVGTPKPQVATQVETPIPSYPEAIDILASHQIDLKNENQLLISQFRLLITQIEHQIIWSKTPEEKKKNGFRLTQIKKAVGIFESHPGKITSSAQAQKLRGIGPGIGKRVDEIMTTGTLQELKDREYVTEYTRTVKELMDITGIGEVRARQLVDNFHVKGVVDLREKISQGIVGVAKNQLTHHMVVGLKYYDDIMKKIPRSETETIDRDFLQPIAKELDPELVVQVCGSFRRGREFSGDIDVLVSHPKLVTDADFKSSSRKYLIELVDKLAEGGFLVDSLTDKGQTKYMGVCKLSKTAIGRRIDIRFVPFDCYAPALLYFTGSWHFNKIFRGIANDHGYTVNEYGVFHFKDRKKGDKIPAFSEEDIFKIVGVKYMTPKQRDL